MNRWKTLNKQKAWLKEVVRIVTPGTVMEQGGVDEKQNNYILSFVKDEEIALSYCDVSTGEFKSTHFQDEATLLNEITTINLMKLLLMKHYLKNSNAKLV